ncbi:hypothetical protein DFA_03337 [Cavenderia fasciculata]|uniref:SH3 domain-containing protein n=1 Tax=Cavenderia fasciculata TaxID=261658 RepID=F4PHA7_CACFS|nr:uncharacterized protein DFA_03337 [Cavenderia fasciculata]EGG25091.1 hypothetical protein DFA_03337 [Cavenderia fasciculata]|eukprot:XP_004362942.1 hypothetical protein DFA_03337 [Cavenderia fasciculata]
MDPLEELSKSSRSVRVSIHNSTSKRLILKSHPLISGQWKVTPPETILPLSTIEFGTESSNLLGSTEAGSIYQIEGSLEGQGQFEFYWNNPYFGKRGFRRLASPGFECDYKVIDTNTCVLRFTVKEIDSGFLKEVEDLEGEIKTLSGLIVESDTALKGMTKMMQVYQSQNDTKQVKLVENTVREKTKHLEDLRLKKESLAKEIETIKRLESDPKFMEQNLTKIREAIDGAVKARKGMEHMREVYDKQKDIKSIEGLDKQIEVKKRETDALRKREQKVIQKVIELKKALGIGATVIPKIRRVQALYDYTKNSDDEISMAIGDMIDVINDENPEWLGGQLNGQVGFFPRSFVKFLEDTTPAPTNAATGVAAAASDSQAAASAAGAPDQEDYTSLYPKARVVYPHNATDEGEITLVVGDTITVYSWEDDYWWEGVLGDKSGYFPSSCVDWIEPEGEITVQDNSYSYYEETTSSAEANPVPPTPTTPQQQQTLQPTTTTTTPQLNKTPSGNKLTTHLNTNNSNSNNNSQNNSPLSSSPNTPSPLVKKQDEPVKTATLHTTPKRELPTTPAVVKPTPTPVVHTPTPTPVVHTPAPVVPTPTPVVHTPTPTPVVHTPAPVVQTPPALPIKNSHLHTSTPINNNNNNNNNISLVGGSFDKILKPLLEELSKQLVEAHQKETAQLHSRIAELEKEVQSLKNNSTSSSSTSSNTTTTATTTSIPFSHVKPPSASPGTIKPAPTVTSVASVVSKATIIRKRI